jgi:hypothetical protein
MGRGIILVVSLILSLAACARPSDDAVIQIDAHTVVGTSKLQLGLTHTQASLDQGKANRAAVERAIQLLKPVSSFQNTHIMGWGAGNPNPKPGVYEWGSLDARMELLKKFDSPIVMTLCTCPGWMKKSGKDWAMEEAPAPEHYDDFVKLCVEAARRYPQVRHYQVWNEFKGLWDASKNNWDAEAYTTLYNKIYDALKAHDPKLNVGGFYLVIQGTGSHKPGAHTDAPITDKDRAVMKYWLQHKHGADFICLDRGIHDFHDHNKYSLDEFMELTPLWEKVVTDTRAETDLPIWFAEYYGSGKLDPRQCAAQYASLYLHMIRAGVSTALLWNPVLGEINHGLISDVNREDGAQPLPHYEVFKDVHDYFPPGTELLQASSSSPWVEVLASKKRTLLVNKSAKEQSVKLNGAALKLAAYEIRCDER